jgi:hypothetical protein
MDECLLCCEPLDIFSIGLCNHSIICYRCTLKSRLKLDNNKCPLCNEHLKEIIITDIKNTRFQEHDIDSLLVYG